MMQIRLAPDGSLDAVQTVHVFARLCILALSCIHPKLHHPGIDWNSRSLPQRQVLPMGRSWTASRRWLTWWDPVFAAEIPTVRLESLTMSSKWLSK